MKSTKKEDREEFPESVDHREVKAHISLRLDGDVLLELRQKAKKKGVRYQTLINRILRESVFGPEISEINSRLVLLEEAVFKKKA